MGETITKDKLVSIISENTGEAKSTVASVIDAFFEAAGDAIAADDKIVITGWLTFERGHRTARKGVNPRTGESLEIPATNTAKVKVGSKLKERAKSSSSSPSSDFSSSPSSDFSSDSSPDSSPDSSFG